ncbi:hypothetical protein BT69DRAFT_1278023 [Atractiella rhizophila]|nr:hypothetical protein BT69DRAFT_1278023 [Atractiella rhizophila]
MQDEFSMPPIPPSQAVSSKRRKIPPLEGKDKELAAERVTSANKKQKIELLEARIGELERLILSNPQLFPPLDVNSLQPANRPSANQNKDRNSNAYGNGHEFNSQVQQLLSSTPPQRSPPPPPPPPMRTTEMSEMERERVWRESFRELQTFYQNGGSSKPMPMFSNASPSPHSIQHHQQQQQSKPTLSSLLSPTAQPLAPPSSQMLLWDPPNAADGNASDVKEEEAGVEKKD